MRMSKSLGVRKGAWTQDEDILLRNCIQKYGEGKWHQVPLRAGLNRCRKSCRLRWLNYLKPDIKRGEFAVDEVDLLIRLHKLLGNRWSLIAGRIPGRTANDVKNYWNTHMQKKMASAKEKKAKPKDHQSTTETTLIKPRARTFSRNLGQYLSKAGQNSTINHNNIPFEKTNLSHPPPELPPPSDDNVSQWWNDLFDDKEGGSGDGLWFGCSEDGQGQPPVYQTFPAHAQQVLSEDSVHDGANAWSDFSMDMDIWHLLHSDQDLI